MTGLLRSEERLKLQSLFPYLLVALACLSSVPTFAHDDDDKKKKPTKAAKELKLARTLMDAAKKKLAEQGKYSCCIKAPKEAKGTGCDLCAKENGSCNCGANLAAGKGVCGECLGGWKTGKGLFPGVKAKDVTLLDSSHQHSEMKDTPEIVELTQAKEAMIRAKKILVSEGRFNCCVSHGGCNECAEEASCGCAKQALKGAKSKGVCSQCVDGWHAGIGRLPGLYAQDMKMDPSGHMDGMHEHMSFAGVSEMQEASGTSWQPSASPMHASHGTSGRWSTMLHYNAFIGYDNQGGKRGAEQFGSQNFGMFMAKRAVGKDELDLRAMLSLEPLTVTPRGYPLILQSGEAYGGKPLVDRQHPHNFFGELAARFRHPIGENNGLSLYYGVAGEPALGPPSYVHRLSAMDNPAAPISHHWQDSTHTSWGVVTLGGWSRNLQLEASVFTGREPGEHRFALGPQRFDSYSTRLTYNPTKNWSLQTSYGFRHDAEELTHEDQRRTTASAIYTLPLRDGGVWTSSLIWGRNSISGMNSDSYLLESSLNLARRNTLFTRIETVSKSGSELDLPTNRNFDLTQYTLGYVYDLTPSRAVNTGLGASVTLSQIPNALKPEYGSNPVSFFLFLRLKPR